MALHRKLYPWNMNRYYLGTKKSCQTEVGNSKINEVIQITAGFLRAFVFILSYKPLHSSIQYLSFKRLYKYYSFGPHNNPRRQVFFFLLYFLDEKT